MTTHADRDAPDAPDRPTPSEVTLDSASFRRIRELAELMAAKRARAREEVASVRGPRPRKEPRT